MPSEGAGLVRSPRRPRGKGEGLRSLKTSKSGAKWPSESCPLSSFYSLSLPVSPVLLVAPFISNHCFGLSLRLGSAAPVNMATWPLGGGRASGAVARIVGSCSSHPNGLAWPELPGLNLKLASCSLLISYLTLGLSTCYLYCRIPPGSYGARDCLKKVGLD